MKPTHQKLIEYFENLNAQSVDFQANSFFRIDINEIEGAFRDEATYPCMVVESPEGSGAGSSFSNSVINRVPAFTIYKNPEKNNYVEQTQFLDDCEVIGLKILSRMRLDATKEGSLLYDRFEFSDWTWIKVGPVFTNKLYGYRFMGKIGGSENMQVNHEDWNDLDSNC